MPERTYIVATIRDWNIVTFNKIISKYSGKWHLVTKNEDLTADLIERLKPRYVFFPHWSYLVPRKILELTECIGFHETDLPFGRGGSPIQNLISRGHRETVISAFRMAEKLDAGPIYCKRRLSLEGLAEEIYIRTSKMVAEMILEIVNNEPVAKEQEGTPIFYKRRTPDQSEISQEFDSLEQLFDHIRMLDAEGYPRAFIRHGKFKIMFSRPALRTERIETDVTVTMNRSEEEESN